MPTQVWFKPNRPNQVELSTANFGEDTTVPQFFDPARGQFISQSMQAVFIAPAMTATPTADPSWFQVQRPIIAHASTDPVYKLRTMLDRLEDTKNFREDWDSYGSQPPSNHAIEAARDLVWNVISRRYPTARNKSLPYSIVPLSGSGVQIEWHGVTDSIEVEVGRDGRFGYLLTKNEASPNRHREERDNVSEAEILRLVTAAIA